MSSATCLLGVIDEPIDAQYDAQEWWSTNKFGGLPSWMYTSTIHPTCEVCGCPIPLVCQLYAPLHGSNNHRTLYLFCCVSKECRKSGANSWKLIRQETPDTSKNQSMKEKIADEWGIGSWGEEDGDEDGWAIDDALRKDCDASDSNEVNSDSAPIDDDIERSVETEPTLEIMMSSIRIEDHMDSTHKRISPYFAPFYMSVFDESHFTNQEAKELTYEERLYKEYKDQQGITDQAASGMTIAETTGPVKKLSSNDNSSAGEKYEKTKHADKAFYQFKKRIQLCPSQCLRYRWCGNSLLLSSVEPLTTEFDKIPRCPRCQSKRVFEMQLLPQLISHMTLLSGDKSATNNNNLDNESSDNGPAEDKGGGATSSSDLALDFGALYAFTCLNSCWTGPEWQMEEFVVHQNDPDSKFFN